MNKLVAEALGTFALLFFGAGSITLAFGSPGPLHVGFAFGVTVAAMIYCFGRISGAHFNPAVSLAMAVAGRMSPGEMLSYWIAQIAGGLVATVALVFIMNVDITKAQTAFEPHNLLGAVIFEVVATFFFVTVIMRVSGKETALIGGLVVGLFLMAMHLAGMSYSGASLNPARSLATNAFSIDIARDWVYIVAPLVGGALAGFVNKSYEE